MRSRVIAARKEPDRLQLTRIGRIEDRDSVAEHVPNIQVPAVPHHLHAVGPSANIGIGNVPQSLSNPLGRNSRFLGATRPLRERGEPQHAFSAIPPRDFHTLPSIRNTPTTSLHRLCPGPGHTLPPTEKR